MKPVIMESPLRGDFKRNLRYALWCARYLTVVQGYAVYASHLVCPLFMDDRDQDEREMGIQCALVLGDLMPKRIFCIDFGWSEGMERAKAHAFDRNQPCDTLTLESVSPSWWQRFVDGEMPHCTPGFALTAPMATDTTDMLLFCPRCHAQHVDAPEKGGWTNPPHRSHLCHSCGTIWRPADVATNGVARIETLGRKDTWGRAIDDERGRDPGVPKVTPWPGDTLDNYRKEGSTKEGWDTLLYDCDRAQELIAAHERDGERYRERIAELEADIAHIRNRLRILLEAEWK